MTSIEWFYNELIEHKIIKKEKHFSFVKNFASTYELLFEQAKEMHKQEMKEMYLKGIENYDPTFKRKDDTLKDYHIVDTNKMVERLIDFQIYINTKGLITNHDWDFEKIAKKYIKSLKQPKKD